MNKHFVDFAQIIKNLEIIRLLSNCLLNYFCCQATSMNMRPNFGHLNLLAQQLFGLFRLT